MKWARVDADGVIQEFTFTDPVGRFHPSLVWVEVADNVEMFSRFTSTGIEPPVPMQEITGEDVEVTNPTTMPPPDPNAKGPEEANPPTDLTVQVVQQ